ncbi:hypothetical protein [Marinovum sp.]|uniref:hypothetical protein n=1 Tax=Marinovum sp. TaxID=2024839 RepID=UPI003A93E895
MTKVIYLHAGAHRTGTSSFQMCLSLNQSALAAANVDVAYPGRDDIPGGTLRLPLSPDGQAGVARRLRYHSPDPRRALLLSEENVTGQMFPFLRGQFYPKAEERLNVLAAGLATAEARIARLLLVVRRYDDFFASAYRKRAEDHPVASFDKRVPDFLAMDRGWPELVEALSAILQPVEFFVVDYERRPSRAGLLRLLLPGYAGPVEEPQRVMNLSATDVALEHLQARYRAGEELERPAWQAVIAEHADQRDGTGFAEFKEADRRVLSERYAADLDRIGAIPGVTLLR